MGPPGPFNRYDPSDSFFRWDARWYQSVADAGYSFAPGQESNIAFFPVYPLLTRALSGVPGDTVWAGLLVSNVALLLACFVLQDLVRRETKNRAAADGAVLFLVLSPVGFFFSIFYAESLFLLWTIASVACTRRHRFGLAALFCALASGTKPFGVLLLLPLAMELVLAVRDGKTSARALLWLWVAPAGLLAYMGYLHEAWAWIAYGARPALSRMVSSRRSGAARGRARHFFDGIR